MSRGLTKPAIKAAVDAGVPAGKTQIVLWDARPIGLGLKIRATGSASWVYVYRPRGAPKGTPPKTVTLGSYPSLEIDDARREALRHVGKVAGGGDPAAELRLQRLKSRSRLAVALDAYDADMVRRQVVARVEAMSILRRGFAPLLNVDVGTLDQPTLINRITAIATQVKRRKDGSPYRTPGAAAEFRKHAHAFLAWCTATGLTRHNALAGYRIPRQTRGERLAGDSRQGKALSDAELTKVWVAAAEMGAFGGLIQLAILTGLRRNELATLEWSDVGAERISIPAARSKMGRTHLVPLTDAMRVVLEAQPRRTGNALVFPSAVSGGVLNGWSKLLPKLIKTAGVRFRIHDLRRSCRSLMSRLGVAESVAELAIGHVKGGLSGIYDLHDFWPERVDAFARVSDHIGGLLAAERSPIRPRSSQDAHLPAERSLVAAGNDHLGS